MSIIKYIDLITSQHKTQPKYIAWLSSTLEIVNSGLELSKEMPVQFDVDKAKGVQLDLIGTIVGRSRTLSFQPTGGASPVLDDDNYRLALKAKIAQNQWDGTIPQIYEIWYSLFDARLIIVDNQDMSMSALVEGQLDRVAIELVTSGYIIPKPAGVGLTIIEVTNVPSSSYIGAMVTGMDIITVSTEIPS
ncbi:DUF2612 domain-containing protein [Paenibacillus tyrfis]|uniref:DUF2612 domain-containing protein n=1 Tax=Paenibacillus tyrfis TaxID=1501230 RepID=UPI000B592734|nr:DUF2612 domain-containing protein [Paenibacillus tyrfis]